MAISVDTEYNLEGMFSPINEFDSLVCCLQDSNTPHDRWTDVVKNIDYLFYPSAENVKCLVSFNRGIGDMFLYGDNFVVNCEDFLPIERGIKGELIADRIAEDEWENYPTDTSLSARVVKMIGNGIINRWDLITKKYAKIDPLDTPLEAAQTDTDTKESTKPLSQATIDSLVKAVNSGGISIFDAGDVLSGKSAIEDVLDTSSFNW